MKMNIIKQVNINTTIDSKDMGVAFAVATQEEQVDFIVTAVKEFNSWDRLDTDTQITRICDEILQSEHRQEIEDFIERFIFFYKSIRKDKTEVTNCETCKFYNNRTYWCSRRNDTTYDPNCSSYKAID